jgi:AraC-like DNA-binding protein
LRSLQEELRTTERSFQRLFEAQIGVSPKVFSRICQFQPAFRQLSQGQFSKLSDIAYDNGYADQSHLIRAFREFTGLTPGEYLERTTAFLAAVGGEE